MKIGCFRINLGFPQRADPDKCCSPTSSIVLQEFEADAFVKLIANLLLSQSDPSQLLDFLTSDAAARYLVSGDIIALWVRLTGGELGSTLNSLKFSQIPQF